MIVYIRRHLVCVCIIVLDVFNDLNSKWIIIFTESLISLVDFCCFWETRDSFVALFWPGDWTRVMTPLLRESGTGRLTGLACCTWSPPAGACSAPVWWDRKKINNQVSKGGSCKQTFMRDDSLSGSFLLYLTTLDTSACTLTDGTQHVIVEINRTLGTPGQKRVFSTDTSMLLIKIGQK